jgi:hypothetical protein
VIPHRLGQRQTNEPSLQSVVLKPLDQQPLAANRIQQPQQQRLNQTLWRDRGCISLRLEPLEPIIHLRKRLRDHRAKHRTECFTGTRSSGETQLHIACCFESAPRIRKRQPYASGVSRK